MLVQSPRARAYLELVRLPNLFTAVGDIVAGYLIVAGGVDVSWGVLAILNASSVCFYAGGVVLNDYDARHFRDYYEPYGATPQAPTVG